MINKLKVLLDSDLPIAEDPVALIPEIANDDDTIQEDADDEFDNIVGLFASSSTASSSTATPNDVAMAALPAELAMETDGELKKCKKGRK